MYGSSGPSAGGAPSSLPSHLNFFTPTLSHLQYLFIVYLMFHVLDRQIEYISRLDFLWSSKLAMERAEAKLMREVNQLLLKNILPIHVANRFLSDPEQISTLYYETYSSCAVLFAAIPNFFKFYMETAETDDGLQYLSVLNDIICEFDKVRRRKSWPFPFNFIVLLFFPITSCFFCHTSSTALRRLKQSAAPIWRQLVCTLDVLP